MDRNLDNEERLLHLLNIHRKKRCFIVGNGPSLTIDDLDKLKNEITFASNRIMLAFGQTEWRPTYYTVCDAVVARDNKDAIREVKSTKVFADYVRSYLSEDPDAIFLNPPRGREEKNAVLCPDGVYRLPEAVSNAHSAGLVEKIQALLMMVKTHNSPKSVQDIREDLSWPVSWNLIRGARAGHSVVNMSIKIAYWMGIREIYTIGMDHNFVVPDSKTGEVIGSNEVIVSDGEVNHFHPDYRRPGDKWTMPKTDVMAEEFCYARKVLESAGGTIKNASRFSKLDSWERVSFDSLFS